MADCRRRRCRRCRRARTLSAGYLTIFPPTGLHSGFLDENAFGYIATDRTDPVLDVLLCFAPQDIESGDGVSFLLLRQNARRQEQQQATAGRRHLGANEPIIAA